MSRRTMPYHRRYHQDALQGYRKLTLEERGAYTTILDLIYDEGGPIDFNERWLAGELNCSVRKARSVIDALIEARKLYLTGAGKISNHRAETELENALKISRKCSENVAKREEKKRENTKIRKEISKKAEPSINVRSTIPYTSTIYRKDNSEYDAGREAESTAPPPVKSAQNDEREISPSQPITVGCDLATGPDYHVEHAVMPLPGGERLLMALDGRGDGKARAYQLAAIQRARRH